MTSLPEAVSKYYDMRDVHRVKYISPVDRHRQQVLSMSSKDTVSISKEAKILLANSGL
jgi:hypothetical protein